MAYRRTMLLLSIVTAACIHVALYFAAPHIYLIKANSAVRDLSNTFRVEVVEMPSPAVEPWRVLDDPTRPESVRELLRRENEVLLPDTFEREWADVPDQADRLSENAGEREHALEFDADRLRTMEAKVLEIQEQDAREDLEIARRVVSASEPRFLGPDDLPTLRGGDAESAGAAGDFFSPYDGPGTGPGGAGSGAGPGAGGEALSPDRSESTLDDETPPDFAALGAEDAVARDAIKTAIRQETGFDVLDEAVSVHVETYVDQRTGEGYFELQIYPRDDTSIPVVRKEVTFVLDASKSIGQRKLDAAARGIAACIRSMAPEDRFNIVVFRDRPSYFQHELVAATAENKAAAVHFLGQLESIGSTDVYGAMREVVLRPSSRGISNYIVLITDGRPTGDALAGRDLINAVTLDNTHRRTIYTIGAGTSANRYLLDLLAYRNKGMTFISPNSNALVEDIPRFFERIREPVLVNLTADYGRIPRDEVYPREIPDFYRGRAVTVYGKFDPARHHEVVMRLHGRAGSEEKELVFKTDLRASNTGDPSIAEQWAFQKSYYLIGEICAVGEVPVLIDELNRLSREYGVRTSYTP